MIVYSPMGSGLLTGAITRERIAAMPDDDWRKTDARFTEPQLTRHLALAARLRAVAERHGTTPGAVAVAWTLRNPAVDGAITGFRRPAQVDPILAAADLELTGQDVAEIEAGELKVDEHDTRSDSWAWAPWARRWPAACCRATRCTGPTAPGPRPPR